MPSTGLEWRLPHAFLLTSPPGTRSNYCATSKWLDQFNRRRLRRSVSTILPAEPAEERRCLVVLRELEALRRIGLH